MINVSPNKNTRTAQFKRFNTARNEKAPTRLSTVREPGGVVLTESRASSCAESELASAQAPVYPSESALDLGWAADSGSESGSAQALRSV